MKRTLYNILPALFVIFILYSCNKENPGGGGSSTDLSKVKVSLDALITKATDTDFEEGDKMGVYITAGDTVHCTNALFTCKGGVFSGEVYWYPEAEKACQIRAYYPFQNAGMPKKVCVLDDQSTTTGFQESDFIYGSKSGVYPSQSAITLSFKHMLSKIGLKLSNESGSSLEAVTLDDVYCCGDFSEENLSITVDSSIAASGVKMQKLSDTTYRAVLIPYKASMRISVSLGNGKTISRALATTELVSGGLHKISVKVLPDSLAIYTKGMIADWTDEGFIPGGDEPGPKEPTYEDFGTYFVYDGVTYPTVNLKDGRRWMAKNMRYVPYGREISDDISDISNGVWYPVDKADTSFIKDPSIIEEKGVLYNFEAALNVKYRTIDTTNYKTFEGAKGICPPGWHIPTADELLHLVGYIALHPSSPYVDAPYYDKASGHCYTASLNKDGMNIVLDGAVYCPFEGYEKPRLISPTTYSLTSTVKSYRCKSDTLASKEIVRSLKNVEIYAMMSAAINSGTSNGAAMSGYSGAYLRCIKDEE